MGELKRIVEEMTPANLAKLRGKRQNLSSRDKQSLVRKVEEIETFCYQIGVEIILNKIEK